MLNKNKVLQTSNFQLATQLAPPKLVLREIQEVILEGWIFRGFSEQKKKLRWFVDSVLIVTVTLVGPRLQGVAAGGIGDCFCSARGNSRKNEVALETPNTPPRAGSLLP